MKEKCVQGHKFVDLKPQEINLWQRIKAWWMFRSYKQMNEQLKYSKVIVSETSARVIMEDGLELFYHQTQKDGVEIPIRKIDGATIYPYDGWGKPIGQIKKDSK